MPTHTFLAYAPENETSVETLARRLQQTAGVSFWFAPWHSVPGQPLQEQMEDALLDAHSCAVFISDRAGITGWQTEQMRTAIQSRVEDSAGFRVIPVLLPGVNKPSRRDMPPFLRRYELVEFRALDDEQAIRRLLAGILGVAPAQVEGYLQAQPAASVPTPPTAPTADPPGGAASGSVRYVLIRLREVVATRFSEGELRTLCFDLGIDYDDLPGDAKADKARELVSYCARREQIAVLVDTGKRLRPDIPWDTDSSHTAS